MRDSIRRDNLSRISAARCVHDNRERQRLVNLQRLGEEMEANPGDFLRSVAVGLLSICCTFAVCLLVAHLAMSVALSR